MLSVSGYAEKYCIPESTVYSGLYTGRIKGERTENGWLIEDVPPPLRNAKAHAATIEDLDHYDLALLWLNSTIMEDSIVVLRSKDEFVPSYFAEKFGCALWRRESGSFVCKISSISLVHSLRELGFTGRKDHALSAPDGGGAAFAAAFIESRASFVRQLRYDRHHPMDKKHAYYVPAITMCASTPIMLSVVDVLHSLGLIPARKLYPAANQTSSTLKITSFAQLDAIRNELSVCGKNAVFWESFDRHIRVSHQPYFQEKE